MTVAAYSIALDQAYRAETAPAVIFAVKQAIINQIRVLDPKVSARTTDFYSHSFAPDIILSWRQGVERPLFVRQDVVDNQLTDDLLLMQRERPIIFGLEPALLRQERLPESGVSARETSTLITDASGIGEIAERKEASRVVDIAAPALLQGGRGVLDERAAADVASGLAHGFVAAGNLATEETRDAVNLIEYTFQSAIADRMVEFLRAVWIGAGGSASTFPGLAHLQSGLTNEALQFLLEFEQNDSLEFWRRVGSNVSLERLLELDLQPSRNLNALVVANLDHINARACGVSDREPAFLDEQDEEATGWHRRGDALTWKSENILVRFGESKDSVRSRVEDSNGLPLSELLSRAGRVDIPFENVELLTAARKIDYGLSDNAIGQDVTDDPQLRSMAESLGTAGVVRRAVASIPEAASMVLDFASGIASGRTAARYSLAQLIVFAIPLLTSPRESDGELMQSMVDLNRALFEPPGLFDI